MGGGIFGNSLFFKNFFYCGFIWFSGPELHVLHVILFSVGFNNNLEGGGNRRAIESNWGVNRVSQKF